jgi:hypothetical protein
MSKIGFSVNNNMMDFTGQIDNILQMRAPYI